MYACFLLWLIPTLLAYTAAKYTTATVAIYGCIGVLVSPPNSHSLFTVPKTIKTTTTTAFLLFLLLSTTHYPSKAKALNPKNLFMAKQMVPQPKRLLLLNTDVIKIGDCSDSTASRKIKQAKDALAKEEHQPLSIKEYCTYYNLDYIETLIFLQLL